MGENSAIEWTDHTFNPWLGCTKVSAACDHCYAEAWAKRTGHPKLWAGERRRTTPENWNKPLKWNLAADRAQRRDRVFCSSLADVFDNQIPDDWRHNLWDMILFTPALDWLVLTKRPQNIRKMLPSTWGDGWPHVWLGTTVENQEEAERRIPHLLAIPAAVRFLSCEPLLGPIKFRQTLGSGERRGIDWVICGGESGAQARPMHPDWARSLRDQCAAMGVAFHFKQWGEWAPGECAGRPADRTERVAYFFNNNWDFGRLTPKESAETHVDDEPDVYWLGKKAAGRLLDGVEHNGMPR